MTGFHWALRDPKPGLVVDFAWDVGEDNPCTLLLATRSGPALGADDLQLYELQDQPPQWGYGSSGDAEAAAHAGPVDTRESSEDDHGGHMDRSNGTFSGVFRYTWLLTNAQGGESRYFGDPSIAAGVSFTCTKPFTLAAARTGTIGMLLTDTSLSGGVGLSAWNFVAGTYSASIGDSASVDLASPQVRYGSGWFGTQATRVLVTTPQGEHEWTHAATNPIVTVPVTFLEDGAPGTYDVTVDRAGARFEAFWFAAWGVEGPLDLTGSLTSASVIDDPSDDR